MFNKYQLKYLLDKEQNINYENFYKVDLIEIIKILNEEITYLKQELERR